MGLTDSILFILYRTYYLPFLTAVPSIPGITHVRNMIDPMSAKVKSWTNELVINNCGVDKDSLITGRVSDVWWKEMRELRQ